MPGNRWLNIRPPRVLARVGESRERRSVRMSGSGMIGKRSLAFVGMVAGGLAGVLGAYISLAANDMLSSSQLWAAATAGTITGLLLGILMTCILTSCNPVKMLKGLQAAGAKLSYWAISLHIRMLWGPLSGWCCGYEPEQVGWAT